MAAQLKGTNGFAGAIGEVVDRAGENLLAGAALAGDQNVDFGPGDAPRVVHQFAHSARND